uniref:type II toxin-antitoxin system RelE family toxin n=1 Tax=Dialister sp. TaxID=1955814 RepID=UPI004028641C
MAIAISSQFLGAFARLPKKIQGKTTEFINKFRADPTSNGINFEKINGALDNKIYSVRIDQTYRGIVVRQPETNTYLLLWVDHHDEAYQWAVSKRCDVNPINGSIQIYDMRTILHVSKTEKVEKHLFDPLSDENLLQLCV